MLLEKEVENMNNNRSCSAAIGSVTQAMRAGRALAGAAIPTTVIKFEESGRSTGGCVYGVTFACSQINNVRVVLEQERIRVKQWKEES